MVLFFCLPTKTLAKQNVLMLVTKTRELPVRRNFGQQNTAASSTGSIASAREKQQRIFPSEASAAFMTMDDARVDWNILQYRVCWALTQAAAERKLENMKCVANVWGWPTSNGIMEPINQNFQQNVVIFIFNMPRRCAKWNATIIPLFISSRILSLGLFLNGLTPCRKMIIFDRSGKRVRQCEMRADVDAHIIKSCLTWRALSHFQLPEVHALCVWCPLDIEMLKKFAVRRNGT